MPSCLFSRKCPTLHLGVCGVHDAKRQCRSSSSTHGTTRAMCAVEKHCALARRARSASSACRRIPSIPSSAFSTAFLCDLACSISHASAAWSSEIKTPRGPGGFAAAAAALLLAHPLSCPPHPCVRAGVGDHMTSVRLAAVLWSAAVLYARSNVLLSNAAYSPRRRRDQGFVVALGGFDWE
jgi:hypothetical protein